MDTYSSKLALGRTCWAPAISAGLHPPRRDTAISMAERLPWLGADAVKPHVDTMVGATRVGASDCLTRDEHVVHTLWIMLRGPAESMMLERLFT
jgi:hypothetical protein